MVGAASDAAAEGESQLGLPTGFPKGVVEDKPGYMGLRRGFTGNGTLGSCLGLKLTKF